MQIIRVNLNKIVALFTFGWKFRTVFFSFKVERELASSKKKLSQHANSSKHDQRNGGPEALRYTDAKVPNVNTKDTFGPTISTTAALIKETIDQAEELEGVQFRSDLLATQASFLHNESTSNRRGPIALIENATLEYESG